MVLMKPINVDYYNVMKTSLSSSTIEKLRCFYLKKQSVNEHESSYNIIKESEKIYTLKTFNSFFNFKTKIIYKKFDAFNLFRLLIKLYEPIVTNA